MADTFEELPVQIFDVPEKDEQDELVEEMAASAVINETFAEFLGNLTQWFEDLKYTSEDGNPVRTHLEILSFEEGVITEVYALKDKLLADVAQRGEELPTKGGSLRTQVIVDAQEEN